MIISNLKSNDFRIFAYKKNREQASISFTSAPTDVLLYPVKNSNIFKKAVPTIAFVGSLIGGLSYLFGATGLFYDSFKEKQGKAKGIIPPKDVNEKDGVKTIKVSTEFGKMGLKTGRLAVASTAIAGIATGLGEGVPLMAIGEATNLNASQIIETPLGTGLFGIGIASIFAGLALDNTPHLKLNSFDLMAEKGIVNKSKMILKNMYVTGKEISSSIFEIAKNVITLNGKFFKNNIIQGTPKTVVFGEAINKEGRVIFSKMLRHNKNYMMHAASFTLGLGGLGLVLSSLFHKKKAGKSSLVVEEGGFLFDNIGMTRYGLDKLTTGGKTAGTGFAVGGIINAISQFMGLDNKEGRAMQWLGVGFVFAGFSVDRGLHLKTAIANSKAREALTQVVREWKIDLSTIIKNKKELKILLKEIKSGKEITNEVFLRLEESLKTAFGNEHIKSIENVKTAIEESLGEDVSSNIQLQEIAETNKAKKVLAYCTQKIFGSADPQAIKK